MSFRSYWVYILANKRRTVLYTGVTNSLQRRIWEHKTKAAGGFTAFYNVDRLVYFEEFRKPADAIEREKQLKGYGRAKKVVLIEMNNPGWEDLAEVLFGYDEGFFRRKP